MKFFSFQYLIVSIFFVIIGITTSDYSWINHITNLKNEGNLNQALMEAERVYHQVDDSQSIFYLGLLTFQMV